MGVEFKINGKKTANINELFKDVEKYSEKLNKRIIMAVRAACWNVVKRARELPSPSEELRHIPHQPNYIDFSGHLRQSIGFVIYDKGVKVAENFEQGNDGIGAAQGLAVCDNVAAQFPNSIVAVVVAGMEYAAAVESKGYFVLSEPASHLADELKTYLSQIKLTPNSENSLSE